MPRIIKNVTDMEIDEISLVDRAANQHALVTIAKRAPDEEENMPELELYNEEGELLAEDAELEEGSIVYDADGNAYELELEEDDNTEELEPVGKRQEDIEKAGGFGAFSAGLRGKKMPMGTIGQASTRFSQGAGLRAGIGQKASAVGSHLKANKKLYGGGAAAAAGGGALGYGLSKSYAEEVMEELSKAYSDEERDAVLSKAFGEMDTLRQAVVENQEMAQSERDLRLTREYISKAEEYNLPVAPEELGPVLYRMAETMSYDDCAVIAKCLESAGEILFEEVGYIGGGDNADVMSQVNAYATEEIGKADSATITGVFDANPDAYNEYLAQRG
jgi:hypothetical protein